MSAPASTAPIHPGEILAEEYLAPWELLSTSWRSTLACRPRRINEIVHGKRRISADTALRLARYLGTSEWFWLNLQGRCDIERAVGGDAPVLASQARRRRA